MSKEIQRETNKLIDRCYTKGSPDYPDLMVFQRQKFLNELLPLLDRLGVVVKVDRELPCNPVKITEYFGLSKEDIAIRQLTQDCFVGVIQDQMLLRGYVAVVPLICPCKKGPCECPSINRGSFAKYVEEEE